MTDTIQETSDQAIARLAAMSKIEYEACRKKEAKKLDYRVHVLDEAVTAARAKDKGDDQAVEPDIEILEESAWEIIASDDVLAEFAADWHRLIAGEIKNAKLLYLIATSRLFPKAMHAAIKGPSSAGKSEIRRAVLSFFPPESVISFTSLSEKALLYTEEGFEHKILSMGEASGSDEQSFQDYLLRELMSEGKLRYPTVQKIGNELTTIVIEKDGPVSFLVTTTRQTLHPENETRMLSLDVDDSQTQTKAVLRKVAEVEGLNAPATRIDFTRWHDFQRWLQAGSCAVVVPYAIPLTAAVPPRAVRLRRDVGQIIRAIKGHALLHRQHRHRDHRGQIIADIDNDYAEVRDLMHDLLRETSEAKPKATVLETIAAVEKATASMDSDKGATALAVGRLMKLDKSAARRRLSTADSAGFVVNLETVRGKPGKYRVTGQVADDVEMLPTVEALKELVLADGLPPLPPDHREAQEPEIQGESGGKTALPPALPPVADKDGGNSGGNGFRHQKAITNQRDNPCGGTVAAVATYMDGDDAGRSAIKGVDGELEIPNWLDRRANRDDVGTCCGPKSPVPPMPSAAPQQPTSAKTGRPRSRTRI